MQARTLELPIPINFDSPLDQDFLAKTFASCILPSTTGLKNATSISDDGIITVHSTTHLTTLEPPQFDTDGKCRVTSTCDDPAEIEQLVQNLHGTLGH